MIDTDFERGIRCLKACDEIIIKTGRCICHNRTLSKGIQVEFPKIIKR